MIDSRELAIACPMVSKIQHCLLEVLHLLQPSCSSSRSTLAASRNLFHLANARASLFHALIHALLTYRAGVSSRAWQTKDSEQVVLYRTTCSELRCRLFIVLGEITGSNLTAGSCVYHDCHCGIQPSVPLLQQCVGDSAMRPAAKLLRSTLISLIRCQLISCRVYVRRTLTTRIAT